MSKERREFNKFRVYVVLTFLACLVPSESAELYWACWAGFAVLLVVTLWKWRKACRPQKSVSFMAMIGG